jgi:hypothetical protein
LAIGSGELVTFIGAVWIAMHLLLSYEMKNPFLKVARGEFHRSGIGNCQEKKRANEEKLFPETLALCS